MLRRAKGINRRSNETLDDYSRGVLEYSQASRMDFGGISDDNDAATKKIEKAIEESLVIVEEDRVQQLQRIRNRYLRASAVVDPEATIDGFFQVRVPKRIPKQIWVVCSVQGKSYRFPFTIVKRPL